jgi:anti-sigma regulatory factor (Ser/Thr protein kinase)
MSTIEHEGHNPDETRNYFTGDHWSIPSDIELAPEAAEAFKQQLLESGWTMEEIDDNFLVEGFQEALNNAIAHGNLEVASQTSASEKPLSVVAAEKFKLLREQDTDWNKQATVDLVLSPSRIEVTISDEGNGFDWRKSRERRDAEGELIPSGNGRTIMEQGYKIYYNEKGNSITLIRDKNAQQ